MEIVTRDGYLFNIKKKMAKYTLWKFSTKKIKFNCLILFLRDGLRFNASILNITTSFQTIFSIFKIDRHYFYVWTFIGFELIETKNWGIIWSMCKWYVYWHQFRTHWWENVPKVKSCTTNGTIFNDNFIFAALFNHPIGCI